MMCGRCGNPIQGKPDRYEHISPTGGGTTIYMCKDRCRAAPHQSTQETPVVISAEAFRSGWRTRRRR